MKVEQMPLIKNIEKARLPTLKKRPQTADIRQEFKAAQVYKH